MMRELNVVFDVRCAQTPGLRDRGIGRHAISLVRNAREFVGARYDTRLVALTDDSLAPLTADIATLFDEVRPNGYTGALARPSWFIELSPMTDDPLFVARLVDHPQILTAAVVYDFIPAAEPDRYLPDPATRLNYALSNYWLSRFDLFWPISRTTARELRTRLQVPDTRIAVTGASINIDLGALKRDDRYSGPWKHVLVVGGADQRKNVECAIRAHGRSSFLNERRIPLVISGRYQERWCNDFRSLHREAGGTPDLLILPGYLSGDQLLELYRQSYCVVVPSRFEGFSLPVVEAMAAGTPVIASHIPAHEELISSADLLFPPDDDVKVASLIERFVRDAAFRRAVVRGQEDVWPPFVDRQVGGAAWRMIMARAEAGPCRPPAAIVRRASRPKMAVMTPLPPDPTGVGHFTAPFLAELGKHVDLHVFTETQSASPVPAAVSVRPLMVLPSVSARFDRVLGIMGNSHFHRTILETLVRYGGACVMHDARLVGLYRGIIGRDRAYRVAEAELGRSIDPGEIEGWLEDETKLETLFLSELVHACEPMFFHSRETVRLVSERYGQSSVQLPFPGYRQWSTAQLSDEARRKARAELGIERDEIAIMTFGFAHRTKAPKEMILAIELLRSWKIPANLYFVGAVIDVQVRALNALCQEIGVAPYVKFIDQFVSEQRYRNYLLAADFGIQLRAHGFGGLSGALADCIAVGLATVANENLCQAIEAPPYVTAVSDHLSPVALANAIVEMIGANRHLHRSESERREYLRDHNFQIYTRRMLQAQGLDVQGR
jgi:glycosyltransferase involved in cell wall biosynthesis